MRDVRCAVCTIMISLVMLSAHVVGQDIKAQIQKVSVPPTIDGVGNDPVWTAATAHRVDEFFNVESQGEAPEDEFDLDVTWKALWDDNNLYVLIEVADDILNNEFGCNHTDDSIEIYLDAQNTDEADYNPSSNPGVPAYQFRSIAGNNADAFCGVPFENTSFNGGVNSYEGDDAITQYPQGSDDSVNVTADQAAIDSSLAYSFEVSFSWEALEETPANIIANGEFGFGIQVNDSDFSPSTRETMLAWAHDENDLWQRADVFPSVALSNEVVGPGDAEPQVMPGDADQDLDFDQLDLVRVQVAAKYLTGQSATWGEGDWNGGTGGMQGEPPAGDGRFDQLDIIAALGPGHYLAGPYAALAPNGAQNDGQTSIGYDPGTGELFVDAPAGVELTSVNVDSASGIFTGSAAENLGGSFDNDADGNIFKATFGGSFGSISFGNVAQTGLSEALVLDDLTVVGSLAGGGALGDVDLIYVPEPSTLLLLALGAIGVPARRHRSRSSQSRAVV